MNWVFLALLSGLSSAANQIFYIEAGNTLRLSIRTTVVQVTTALFLLAYSAATFNKKDFEDISTSKSAIAFLILSGCIYACTSMIYYAAITRPDAYKSAVQALNITSAVYILGYGVIYKGDFKNTQANEIILVLISIMLIFIGFILLVMRKKLLGIPESAP